MSNFLQDLRSYIVASTSIADQLGTTVAVHYNHVPQQQSLPYLWFRTNENNVDRTMDGVGGIRNALIDVEVVAATASECQDLSDAVHELLDGAKRLFMPTSTGTAKHFVQGAFMRDKDDNYLPRNIGDDEGRHISAYDLDVWYTT